jgi:hypothetical protein
MEKAILQWLPAESWLEQLANSGDERWRYGDEQALLLDLRGFDSKEPLPIPDDLPCPIIGQTDAATSSIVTQALDCCVRDGQGLAGIETNLRRAPLAASVLVQLCRAIEPLDTVSALNMESLAYATVQSGSEHSAWLAGFDASTEHRPQDPEPLLLERVDDVFTITLNQPQRRNAICRKMRDALVEAFNLAAIDDSIRQLVLQGAGKCFSVGGDLQEFGSVSDPLSGHWIRSVGLPARMLLRAQGKTSAILHGACIGAGIELPAFADTVYAKPDAFFQLPELGFGLIPGAGGCVSMTRRMGRQRFVWMVLSGRKVGARQALQWGLVDRIIE